MGDRRDVLGDLLSRLAHLATDDQQTVADLASRLAGQRLRVAIVGEAKRGKSTVANALVDRHILPVAVTPLTAIATRLVYGRNEHLEVVFIDGRHVQRPLTDLSGLVTEHSNPGNRLGVAEVVVHLDSPILARGLEIVDTPGTGSVYEHNAVEAERAFATMDAAVFVLTADPPISAAERDLLAHVGGTSVATFILLNKIDHLGEAERAEAERFTADVIAAATGSPQRIYPVSARQALIGVDGGFAAFLTAFDRYLDSERVGDVERAVAGHADRIARRHLDEVRLTLRAAQKRTADAADQVAAFRAVLTGVAGRRQDAADLIQGETGRLLGRLNEAADRTVSKLIRRLARELDATLTAELAHASPADIQRLGRGRLVELTAPPVEQWREQQRRHLEDGLAQLDTRLVVDLNLELDRVREQAAHLLGLDLAVPRTAGPLLHGGEFVTSYDETIGQTELLAGAIRRRVPGEFGRRRAAAYVRSQVADLVVRQIGRSRADLQYRLGESSRRLLGAVESRYRDASDRLIAALDDADRLVAETPEAKRIRELLARREEALLSLLNRIKDVIDSQEPAWAH